VLASTPSSIVTLPERSDNNMQMFSISYDVYSISQYFNYFLASAIWIFWFLGLFYGKVVVIDFILVIQIIFFCVLSTGTLTAGYAGMML